MIHRIKAMYDEGRGLGVRAIARELGISRNTVRKYLKQDEGSIFEQQSRRERRKNLDAHRDYIIKVLQDFPGISAVKVWRKLKELHPDLAVSERSARRYIKCLKETITVKQRRYYEPVLDMEPGVQCQVDGGEQRGVLIGGVEHPVYFVVFVLSFSRLMYVGVSDKPMGTGDFIRRHDEAFRYFGGAPEECVYDQTKLVVVQEQYRELKLNQQFHAYATAAGFRIHACEGYDPESKGKVEAGVKYVKQSCFYGETFEDWNHLREHVARWLDETANVRVHGTTGEVPWQRYERDERSHMKPYWTPPFLSWSSSPQETRKVDKTGLISWQSNKYSVPLAYQRSRVGVRVDGAQLVLTDLESGAQIARHNISPGKGQVIKNNDHYRDKEARIEDLEKRILTMLGEVEGKALCLLLKKTNPRVYKDQLCGLLELLKSHGMPRRVLLRLMERTTLSATQIRDYLEAYKAQPERFEGAALEPRAKTPVIGSSALGHYAAVGLQGKEASHGRLH